jgi:hypothetical protein
MDSLEEFENEERYKSFDRHREWAKKIFDYDELRTLFV